MDKINKHVFNFSLTELSSNSGKVFKLDSDKLLNRLKEIVISEKHALKQKRDRSNKKYNWKKEPDLKTEQGKAKHFIKNFYIKYVGNPSQNGGYFNYQEGPREDLKSYKKIINKTLSCEEYVRMFGYGKDQEGYLFVYEDPKTSSEFVSYILENNIVDLEDYVTVNGKKLMTYGYALFLYSMRSSDFKLAEQFKKYITLERYFTKIERRCNDIFKTIKKVDSKFINWSEVDNKGWYNLLVNKIGELEFLLGTLPNGLLDSSLAKELNQNEINAEVNLFDEDFNFTSDKNWKDKLKTFMKVKD